MPNNYLPALSVKTIQSFASENHFQLKNHDQFAHIITYHRHSIEYSVLIRVYYELGVVETRFIDPINGPTILLQRRQTVGSSKSIFENPNSQCSGNFSTRYGLPEPIYEHRIQGYSEAFGRNVKEKRVKTENWMKTDCG